MSQPRRNSQKQGFTIVELMLAMAFVAILLVAVALLTISISQLYAKGVTYKELNQVGSEVSSDIKRTISASRVDDVKPLRVSNGSGSLCVGEYSYVWNDPALVKDAANGNTIKYQSQPARLVKVRDVGGSFCESTYDKVIPAGVEAKDLLVGGGDRDLVVHGLSITPNPSTSTTGRELYTVSLTLGTGDVSAITGSSTCKPPSDEDSNTEYCAINEFTIVARIGNTYVPSGGN